MTTTLRTLGAPTLALLLAACAAHTGAKNTVLVVTPAPVAAAPVIRTGQAAVADSLRYGYVQADVDFMTGMIGHHAQAIKMANWAPTHGADPEVQRLCQRIINAQTDEIRTMQTWLRDHGKTAPEPDPNGVMMTMNGMTHVMLMPGMLTPAQMSQLDGARGHDFDRLFLTFMIQHHKGALMMVDTLFASPGAAQNDITFKFANDVQADQSTEVNRMQLMLAAMGAPPAP